MAPFPNFYSKSAFILDLARQGLNSRQIACRIYPDATAAEIPTRMAYVRVVVRQRKGSSLSQFDRTYLRRTKEERNAAKREKYRNNPVFRQKCLDAYRAWYDKSVRARKAWLAENQLR